MNTETQQAIFAEVMAEIERRPKYQFELVYIDYRDGFDQEQVDMLAKGDWEGLYESIGDWESESQHEGAWALLNDIIGDLDDWDEAVLQDWLHTDAGHEALYEILERDESNPLKDLARNSGNVLLRVKACDEIEWGEVETSWPHDLLRLLGLPETETNLAEAANAIDNAAVEYQGVMGYWLLAVQVSTLYDLWTQPHDKLRVTNPGFWLANPWNGSGFDAKFEGEVIINRADLRTDHGAFGYSWTEVAGPVVSYYESKIEAVEEVNA